MTTRMTTSRAKALRLLLAAAAVAVAMFALPASPASAVYNHDALESTIDTGTDCTPFDLAIDEAHGWVYVSCERPYPQPWAIRRFNLNGSPAPFSAVKPYIEGNTLTGDPGGQEEKLNGRPELAVDNSSSPNKGRLFITSSPNADVFNPSGEFFTGIAQPVETTIENTISALDVGPDGSIYVGSQNPGGRISKYSPGFQEVKKFYFSSGEGNGPCYVRADTTGGIWYDACFVFFNSAPGLFKYEVDQFTDELNIPAFGASKTELEPFVGKTSPYQVTSPVVDGHFFGYDVDTNTNDLYVNREDRIEVWSPGEPDDPIHQDAPPIGTGGALSGSHALAYANDSNKIYVGEGHTIKVFGAGDIIPDVRTSTPAISDIGHTSATVHGRVELAGGGPITECHVQYALNDSYTGPSAKSETCTPDPNAGPPASNFGTDTDVSAELKGLETGVTYHVRVAAKNADGENFGVDRTLIPAYVLQLQTLPATEINTDGAQLNASFNPDGESTKYFFEYGTTTNYGFTIPVDKEDAKSVPGTSGVIEVGEKLAGLPSGTVFHYRVVAFNKNGSTIGQDRTFRVASPPDVSASRAVEIAERSVTLRATVDPVGFATKYQFQYGTTPSYGKEIPLAPTEIGAGSEGVKVEQKVEGLEAGHTYHFRVIAENAWGKTLGPDTTFDYAPPGCPNDHVRQQSGSSYLPDCRSYELVSPGAAGAVLLYPSNVVAKRGEGEADCCENNRYNAGLNYMVNRGFAQAPSRFSFYGGVGTVNGINSPTSLEDMYMATRTQNGWVTTLPGIPGGKGFTTGRKECSESMSLCIDHQENTEYEFKREFAPYLYSAAGEYRGRLPTNVDVIPGGTQFVGFQRMSGDFSHFLFGSTEYEEGFFEPKTFPGIKFTPDGLTTGVGSAYDNNIAAKTVTLISKTPEGDDIPTDLGKKPKVGIDFPGLTPDGSRVLMSTPAGGKSRHLYMSINDLLHYEISQTESGEPVSVEPIGMVRDGSAVLYTTKAKITAADTDESSDIYRWDPSTEEATLLTGGPEAGPGKPGFSDSCATSWDVGCGAVPVSPERAHPNNNAAYSVPTAEDDLFAEDSGAVYFFSPENLDPAKPGIPNQRNLYIYREGGVHLVATFERRHDDHADADLTRREPRGLRHQIEADVLRKQRLRGDVHLLAGIRRHSVCLLQPDRAAPCRRRPRQPGRALHGRRRPRLLRHQRRARPARPERQNHRRLRVRRRPAAADQLRSRLARLHRRLGTPQPLLRPGKHRARGGQPRRHRRLLLDLRNPGRGGPQRPVRQVLRRPQRRRLRRKPAARALCRRRRVPRRRQRPAGASGDRLGRNGAGRQHRRPRSTRSRTRNTRSVTRRASAIRRGTTVVDRSGAGGRKTMKRKLSLTLAGLAAIALMGIGAASAQATDPGFSIFSVIPTDTQAGGHPDVHIDLEVNQDTGFEEEEPCGPCLSFRTIAIHWPAGFIGNPHATPKCTLTEFNQATARRTRRSAASP